VVPSVEQRKLLQLRMQLVSLPGLAEESRVPEAIIQKAILGRSISDRNWEKLKVGLVTRAPAPNTRRRG
jgi:hypothetical protein